MGYENYKLTRVEVRGKVAYLTIDNPPVNLITRALLEELTRVSTELEADDTGAAERESGLFYRSFRCCGDSRLPGR